MADTSISLGNVQEKNASTSNQRAIRNPYMDTAVCLLVIIVLYLLSYGPVAVLYRQDILSSSAWHAEPVGTFYAPIEYAMKNPVVYDVMGRYIDFCEGICGMSAPG